MKKKLYFLLSCCLFSLAASACRIEINIDPAYHKDTYRKGDEIVVIIRVTRSHRNCTVSMDETKLTAKGMKIIGATEWKQVSAMSFERKVKLGVTGIDKGKLYLEATRDCNKEFSKGFLELNYHS